MNKNSYFATQIKDRVTMPDVIARYGFKRGRDGRIPCPFHRGEDNNLSCKADFFKCFVCGESGDVISFVQKYHGLSFTDTLQKMDEDFGLSLGVGKSLTDREKLRISQEAYRARRERTEAQKMRQAKENAYHEAFDEYSKHDRAIMEGRPRNADEEPTAEFLAALSEIETARYMLDCAEEEVYYEQQRNY